MADEGHTLATAPYYRLLRTLSGEHFLGGERSRSTLGRASVGARRTGREALGGGAQAGSGRGNICPVDGVANSICASYGGADANTRIKRGAHRRSVEESTTLCCASASIGIGVETNLPILVRSRLEVGVRAEENLPLPFRKSTVGN